MSRHACCLAGGRSRLGALAVHDGLTSRPGGRTGGFGGEAGVKSSLSRSACSLAGRNHLNDGVV